MPFGMAKLSAEAIAAITEWIDKGAPFPQPIPPVQHWAFRQPVRPTVPQSKSSHPIDAFLALERSKRSLTAVALADRRTLLRRASLDLIGIPPTPAQFRDFLADTSKDAYEKVVDRLFADPRYGERWARHWMDVWRYSDWYGWRKGKDVRNSSRHMWRWRDWIVESLNADKGYDRMILEMLAGDELAPNDPQTLRATGYLARSFSKYDRHGWMQDAVDHTAMGMLGLTLKCARCHDHKYDPFSQEEYFQFRAFFEPYHVRTDRVPGQTDIDQDGLARVYDDNPAAETFLLVGGDIQNPDKDRRIVPGLPMAFAAAPLRIEPVPLNVQAYYPDIRDFVHADLLAQAKAEIEKAEKLDPSPLSEKTVAAARAALPALEARIRADKAKYSNAPDAGALSELARKAERHAGILKAAENVLRAHLELTAAGADEKKIAVAQKNLAAATSALTQPPEGYTSIGKAYAERSSGRRLALARWIAGNRNPLTARVAINHIWLRHFGKAIVPTVADFGRNGKPPSHPQLLDWLAVELMDNNWSMKHIHRLILTSNAYRLRSTAGVDDHPNSRIDPENTWLWRMNPRRMEAEIVRDSILAVSGQLDSTLGGPEIDVEKSGESRRRSLYLQHTPDIPMQFLKTFDSASTAECYERNESVVPHQALAMANSAFTREQAKLLAQRISGAGNFVSTAFETILGREPTQAEFSLADRFLSTTNASAREDFVHVLLNHNDFVTIR
jgi:hypothetical protein